LLARDSANRLQFVTEGVTRYTAHDTTRAGATATNEASLGLKSCVVALSLGCAIWCLASSDFGSVAELPKQWQRNLTSIRNT
jgi:hypothetical protein